VLRHSQLILIAACILITVVRSHEKREDEPEGGERNVRRRALCVMSTCEYESAT
jgi:hypothetical protein